MRVRLPAIEINSEDPFAACGLKREDFGNSLTSLIDSIEGGGVLSLEGEWGSGKTTFLNMWSTHLKHEHFTVVKFNAWESDHCGDPLVALLSTFEEQIAATEGEGKQWAREAMAVGWEILKAGVPIAVKAATAGIVDTKTVAGDIAAEVNANIGQQLVQDFKAQTEAIGRFRSELKEFAKHAKGKVIVIVDELDRCRPTYAVEMLERIKHLFQAPDIVFLIAIAADQLEHSVKAVYGLGFDASYYLKRFIDLQVVLPKPDRRKFTAVSFERFGIYEEIALKADGRYTGGPHNHIEDVLVTLFEAHNSSLRTIEQVAAQLSIVFAVTDVDQGLFPTATAFLIFLRSENRKLYDQFLFDGLHPAELIVLLKKSPEMETIFDSDDGIRIESWLRAICSSRGASEGFQDLKDEAGAPINDARSLEILSWWKAMNFHVAGESRSYLTRKLEFLDNVAFRE